MLGGLYRACRKLEDMGMHVLGDYNSPVIPALIYVPAKMSAFSKECYERGLAVRVDYLYRLCIHKSLHKKKQFGFQKGSERVHVGILYCSMCYMVIRGLYSCAVCLYRYSTFWVIRVLYTLFYILGQWRLYTPLGFIEWKRLLVFEASSMYETYLFRVL